MDFAVLSSTISSLQVPAYILIFIAMVFEGPLTTISASFAASLGIFNIWIIILLSLLGDLVGDFLHFGIGRFMDKSVIEKYGRRFGLKRMRKIEGYMKKHLGKTLFFSKLTPPMATPTLILAGAGKVSLRRFTIVSLLATLPRTIILVVVGFFFGSAYYSIAKSIGIWQYLVILAAIFIVFAFLIYKLILRFISKNIS